MEDKLKSLLRANLLSLKPYSSARDELPKTVSDERIMLDANENAFGGPLSPELARYPGTNRKALVSRIAEMKGISASRLFLGNGSDEAIDLLIRAFAEPSVDNIIMMPPTYGMYAVQAGIQGVDVRKAPLRPDFSPDPEAVKKVTDLRSKILFLCSPNNPSGNELSEAFILEMLQSFPGLVVLDEAYQDFSDKPSWKERIESFPNLVVLQTFSKAWGMAGLRLGMAFGHPWVIQMLDNIRYPYNLNSLTIQFAMQALDSAHEVQRQIDLIKAQRAWLTAELTKIDLVKTVFPSAANFILVRVQNATGLYQYLAENGVIVRNRTHELHCTDCIRITIGTEQENQRLLACIRQFNAA
jgi:histidinol-phosphate aminotransferase